MNFLLGTYHFDSLMLEVRGHNGKNGTSALKGSRQSYSWCRLVNLIKYCSRTEKPIGLLSRATFLKQ